MLLLALAVESLLLTPRLSPAAGAATLAQPCTSRTGLVILDAAEDAQAQEQAAGAMDQLLNLLGDLEPPEALRELKMATMDDADAPTIRALLYKLVIVQQLDYNLLEGDEPRLEEAKFDFKNKDDAELVGRMQYVYSTCRIHLCRVMSISIVNKTFDSFISPSPAGKSTSCSGVIMHQIHISLFAFCRWPHMG